MNNFITNCLLDKKWLDLWSGSQALHDTSNFEVVWSNLAMTSFYKMADISETARPNSKLFSDLESWRFSLTFKKKDDEIPTIIKKIVIFTIWVFFTISHIIQTWITPQLIVRLTKFQLICDWGDKYYISEPFTSLWRHYFQNRHFTKWPISRKPLVRFQKFFQIWNQRPRLY